MKKARDVLGAMVAGTDGVLAAELIGMDGSPIEVLKLEAEFPAESVTQDVVTAIKLFLYMSRKVEGGSAVTRRDSILLRPRITVIGHQPKATPARSEEDRSQTAGA